MTQTKLVQDLKYQTCHLLLVVLDNYIEVTDTSVTDYHDIHQTTHLYVHTW
jgi:hypothetical protein